MNDPGARASLPATSPGIAGFQPAFTAEGAGRDACAPGWRSRGYLPHFDKPGLIQSITFRLFDSVPSDVIEKWRKELEWTDVVAAEDPKAVELRKRIAAYEDQGYGACWLRRADCAAVVQNALLHFDAQRYHLIEWCVMPNHVHALIEPLEGHTLDSILHSWKSFTSTTCNRILQRKGRFWMPEYHDRYIRGQRHFDAAVEYIRQNPVKAGLCACPEDWPWSSPGTWASSPQSSVIAGKDACAPRTAPCLEVEG